MDKVDVLIGFVSLVFFLGGRAFGRFYIDCGRTLDNQYCAYAFYILGYLIQICSVLAFPFAVFFYFRWAWPHIAEIL